jgi:HSP20 family protein
MSRHVVSPWELALLQRNLEELFEALARPADAAAGGWAPAIDLIDRHDAFIARIDLPGVSAADLEIVLKEHELRISGSKPPAEHSAAQRRCHRVERSFGPFALHVHLPAPIDTSACRASLVRGVLEVVLPRLDPRSVGARRIEVTEEEP